MKKKCFVIGPMNKKEMPVLDWLAKDVISEILDKNEFEVFTPNVADAGRIMNHVIRSCDRSAIVVANITGNNPNVLYEIGVLDAMGKPCVPVKIIDKRSSRKKKDPTPFDRAAYRTFEIEYRNKKMAIKALEKAIHETLERYLRGNIQDNPLTEYYRLPLKDFPSAFGLARSYYYNLLRPAILEEIVEGPDQMMGRKHLNFELLIPPKMDKATREAVDSLIARKIFIPVKIKAPGRLISAHVWSEDYLKKFKPEYTPTIVDIPTTLGTLRENVNVRFGRFERPAPDSDDYREIENDEIMQFRVAIERLVGDEPATPIIRERCKIVDTSNYTDLM